MNQVINSQRFGKRSSKARNSNRLTQNVVLQHGVRVVQKKREVNINGASLGGRVVVEPTLCDFAQNFCLKIQVSAHAAGGSRATNWGADCLKSVEVRSGSNVLGTYNPMKVLYQWSLDRVQSDKKTEIKSVCFGESGTGADTIYLMLPYCGSPMFLDDWDTKKAYPMNLGALGAKRPLQFAIEFSDAASLTDGDGTGLTITSCVLQFEEVVPETPERFRRSYSQNCRDVKIFPSSVALAQNSSVETSGIEALNGSIQHYWISCQSNAETNPTRTMFMDVLECVIDGETFYKAEDQKENRKNAILSNIGVNDGGSGANYISFSRFPNEHYKDGYLHTDGVSRVSLKLRQNAQANATAYVVACCHRTLYTQGGVLKIRED